MAKLVASLTALFLYGSISAASAGGSVEHSPADAVASLDRAVVTETNRTSNANGDETTLLASSSGNRRPSSIGEMSDKERERRKAVCVKENETA